MKATSDRASQYAHEKLAEIEQQALHPRDPSRLPYVARLVRSGASLADLVEVYRYHLWLQNKVEAATAASVRGPKGSTALRDRMQLVRELMEERKRQAYLRWYGSSEPRDWAYRTDQEQWLRIEAKRPSEIEDAIIADVRSWQTLDGEQEYPVFVIDPVTGVIDYEEWDVVTIDLDE